MKGALIISIFVLVLLFLVSGPLKNHYIRSGAEQAINQLWLSYSKDHVVLQLLVVGGDPIELYSAKVDDLSVGHNIKLKEKLTVR